MPENVFQGEIDPEIAALLGTDPQSGAGDAAGRDEIPGMDGIDDAGGPEAGDDAPDLHSGGFPEITKRYEAIPHNAFNDPNYYKAALSNEGENAQRLHGALQKYLNTKDPKDRGLFRQQMIPAFWDFLLGIAQKAPANLPPSKKFLLRFGILHPTFLDVESRSFFAKLVVENGLAQPVYYLDEWMKAVGSGTVKPSTTDEAKVVKNSGQVRFQQLMDKAQGRLDGAVALLRAKSGERLTLERELTERVAGLFDPPPADGPVELDSCYTDDQKRSFVEVQEMLKSLLRTDRELDLYLKEFREAGEDVKSIREKITEEGPAAAADTQAVAAEFETIRQMNKMTIGRQGNYYPILTGEYFHCTPNDIAFRENVISQLAWIESIDQEAFCRAYKNRLTRIVPYVLLLPNYGDTGICWEPFDRHNRATSRGRIALPMYPKSLSFAVLSAVADLRWQVAKERASFYWMEEGLTGNYYQWFQKQKVKGDVKEYFIQDYITWMTKESEGTQKLDKELRGVFWRYMPFSQPVKEKLKGRSLIYQELYQRDLNRAMSDGY